MLEARLYPTILLLMIAGCAGAQRRASVNVGHCIRRILSHHDPGHRHFSRSTRDELVRHARSARRHRCERPVHLCRPAPERARQHDPDLHGDDGARRFVLRPVGRWHHCRPGERRPDDGDHQRPGMYLRLQRQPDLIRSLGLSHRPPSAGDMSCPFMAEHIEIARYLRHSMVVRKWAWLPAQLVPLQAGIFGNGCARRHHKDQRMSTTVTKPRGRQFFANPGPTNIPDSVLRALDRPVDRFPRSGFRRGLRRGVRRCEARAADRSTICSCTTPPATAHGRPSLTNLLSPGDTILVLESGYFSEEWANMARAHGLEVRVVACDWRRASTCRR